MLTYYGNILVRVISHLFLDDGLLLLYTRWGEVNWSLRHFSTFFWLYMAVSWRNKLFLGVNQQPSVSNWQLPLMGFEPQRRGARSFKARRLKHLATEAPVIFEYMSKVRDEERWGEPLLYVIHSGLLTQSLVYTFIRNTEYNPIVVYWGQGLSGEGPLFHQLENKTCNRKWHGIHVTAQHERGGAGVLHLPKDVYLYVYDLDVLNNTNNIFNPNPALFKVNFFVHAVTSSHCQCKYVVPVSHGLSTPSVTIWDSLLHWKSIAAVSGHCLYVSRQCFIGVAKAHSNIANYVSINVVSSVFLFKDKLLVCLCRMYLCSNAIPLSALAYAVY